jgi:beta-galactosidase
VQVESTATLNSIQPWSPEHPALYRLTVTARDAGQPEDKTSFRVGFRQITLKGSQILLNGEPILLRGINRHEFFPGKGQSVPVAQNRKDMEDIKALGANFVRLAHYSQSQDIYDDCDELGLLVWTEIPVWQAATTTLASPEMWKDYAEPQLEAMVRQHRNHPSVMIGSQ